MIMSLLVRSYTRGDYRQLVDLYKQGDLYGGQFDADRDSEERINALIAQYPNAILIAEHDGAVCGTVSLIRDPRTAFLFRFAVRKENEGEIARALFGEAMRILKAEGHKQVLVYSPVGNDDLRARYESLGFTKGGDYSCFWIEGL